MTKEKLKEEILTLQRRVMTMKNENETLKMENSRLKNIIYDFRERIVNLDS